MAVIKNVILDWSGTLVDDLNPVFEAINEIFKKYEKPVLTVDEFREKFILPFPEFFRLHLPEASIIELEYYFKTTFKALESNVSLFPSAIDFLDYCRAREMPLFLLSAIHHEYFEVQSERLGIKHYFKQAYVQAVDKRKTILHLLAEHDLDPKETVFVGDMQHDIESARHGGVISCAVLTGYDSFKKLREVSPDLLFRNLAHLKEHLSRHSNEPDAPPIAAVGALIFNQKNQVLMIHTHKWSNLWGIPGGKIKANEAAEAALKREIKEETNLDISEVEFANIYDCIDSPEFYKKAHFVLLNYTAKSESEKVILNDEAEDYRWCTLDEAFQLPLNTPTRSLLEYARNHRS